MAQTKQQTALWIAGATKEFWNAIAQFDCYDDIADAYDSIDFDDVDGVNMEGDPINLTDYPVRQRPTYRPTY